MQNHETRLQNQILEISLEAINTHAWDLLEQYIPELKGSNQRLVLSMLEMELANQ